MTFENLIMRANCVNDVVLIQEENRPKYKWRKGKISNLLNSKDGLV